ncbi:LysR family transcriptional regulator [Stappia sp.]|uniref:LysR family transcriptional regulator n=1 Tax=Stappia sp. TaxID=1870903 RepID=UPI003A994CEE
MQLQAIAYFNELVKCRSIRRAAQNLGVSPTAVSRQLENLEYHFGAPLVERGARGIVLTAAGEQLAVHARTAMREFDQARQFIDDMRGLKRGDVSVHVNGATGGAILAAGLAEFHKLYPAVQVSVQEGSATEALRAVAAGDSDLALTIFSPHDPQVVCRCRFPLSHSAILSPDHALARQAEIGLEDLARYPLALPDTSFSVRRLIEERLRQSGLPPACVTFSVASITVQKELARLGAAILVLPRLSVARDITAGALVARPFASDIVIDTSLQLSLRKGRTLTFAAERLASHLESRLRAYRESGILD